MMQRFVLVGEDVWVAYYCGVEPFCSEAKRLLDACVLSEVGVLYAPTALVEVFRSVPAFVRGEKEAGDESAGRGAARDGRSFASRASAAAADRSAAACDEALSAVAWGCVEHMMSIAAAAPQSAAECELARLMRSRCGDLGANLAVASAKAARAQFVATFDRKAIERFAPLCATPGRIADVLALDALGAEGARSVCFVK